MEQDQAQWRTERDSMGEIEVPAQHLWGAQTERSRRFFAIGVPEERMPRGVLRALVEVKRAAARANARLGLLPTDLADAIVAAADEVLAGAWDDEFPLSVWQTGSGTQTNMNVNEVLANRGSELLGGTRGAGRKIHPNDHVNLGQSSNDTFPTALHIEGARAISRDVLPALDLLRDGLAFHAAAHEETVKLGRTHLQDALPLTFGQEVSGWVAQLELAGHAIRASLDGLFDLALGGTAVGTGLNAHPRFADEACADLAERHDLPFRRARNPFAALSSGVPIMAAHGALAALAAAAYKIANDVRWLSSGPRAGLGEIVLPANEPGSSIMPGKVNPTQSEALTMIACRVAGNQAALAMADTLSNLELNTARPMMAQALLQSARLLADGMTSFARHAVEGMRPDAERMRAHVDASLMLVTALTPAIGYDRAAHIAHRAWKEGTTLREAALAEGVAEADFDRIVDARAMTRPGQP